MCLRLGLFLKERILECGLVFINFGRYQLAFAFPNNYSFMLIRFLQRVKLCFLLIVLFVYEFFPFQSKYTEYGYKRLILILFTFIEIEINYCK